MHVAAREGLRFPERRGIDVSLLLASRLCERLRLDLMDETLGAKPAASTLQSHTCASVLSFFCPTCRLQPGYCDNYSYRNSKVIHVNCEDEKEPRLALTVICGIGSSYELAIRGRASCIEGLVLWVVEQRFSTSISRDAQKAWTVVAVDHWQHQAPCHRGSPE